MSVTESPLPLEQAQREDSTIAHIRVSQDALQGLCGARLKGITPRPGAGRCVVCLDLARKGFVGR